MVGARRAGRRAASTRAFTPVFDGLRAAPTRIDGLRDPAKRHKNKALVIAE